MRTEIAAPRATMGPVLRELRAGCLEWVDAIHEPNNPGSGRYRYSTLMLRPYSTEATAHVIMILWLLDALAEHPEREAMITFLLEQQDPESGYFKDSLLNESERAPLNNHTWQYIWDHHTCWAITALRVCGVEPRFEPPHTSHADLDEVDPAEFTLSLDWKSPYLVSEHWTMVIWAYLRKHDIQPGDTNPVLDRAFAALESEIIDPQTGLPDKINEQGREAGLGGIFKLLHAYTFCARRYPCSEAAVTTFLSFQLDNGSFAGNENMCINWDALWSLRMLTDDLVRTGQKKEIVGASGRLADNIMTTHAYPDGGFSFFPGFSLPTHNSMRIYPFRINDDGLPGSDVLGTMMSLEVLAIHDDWQRGVPSQSFTDCLLARP